VTLNTPNFEAEAIWAAVEKHTVNNVAGRPAEIILVELK